MNHLIGWDYSVEYDNNNSGSVSKTLSISDRTYNNMQTAAAAVGIAALAVTVVGACVGAAAGSAAAAIVFA